MPEIQQSQFSQWNVTPFDLYNLCLRRLHEQGITGPKAQDLARVQALECAKELGASSLGSLRTSDDSWGHMDFIRIINGKVVNSHGLETIRFRDGVFSTPQLIIRNYNEFYEIFSKERGVNFPIFDITYCTPTKEQHETNFTPLLPSGGRRSSIQGKLYQNPDNEQKDNNQWIVFRGVTDGLAPTDPVFYRSIARTQKFDGSIPSDVLSSLGQIRQYRDALFSALPIEERKQK